MTILMRVHGDGGIFSQIRQIIRGVNPDLSIVGLHTVDQVVADADAQRRIPATVLSLVGLLGLLLTPSGCTEWSPTACASAPTN